MKIKAILGRGVSHDHLATRSDFRQSAMMAKWPTFQQFHPQTSHRLHFGLEMSLSALFKTKLTVQGVKVHACLAYEIIPPDADTVLTVNQTKLYNSIVIFPMFPISLYPCLLHSAECGSALPAFACQDTNYGSNKSHQDSFTNDWGL